VRSRVTELPLPLFPAPSLTRTRKLRSLPSFPRPWAQKVSALLQSFFLFVRGMSFLVAPLLVSSAGKDLFIE